MGRARHDFEALLAAEKREGASVQPDHRFIMPANDEQGWRDDMRQSSLGEVGPATARYDRRHRGEQFRGCDKGCCRSRARSEQPFRQAANEGESSSASMA